MKQRARPTVMVLVVLCVVIVLWTLFKDEKVIQEASTSSSKATPNRNPQVVKNHSTTLQSAKPPSLEEEDTTLKITEPTFEERLFVAKRFAFKVANFKLPKAPKSLSDQMTRLGRSEWFVHDGLLKQDTDKDGCLVYSIGVADRDAYTELMAERGCHVMALDPTVQHPTQWMPNVTFYPWGLRSGHQDSSDNSKGNEDNSVWSHSVYGNISSNSLIYSLPEIIQKLSSSDGSTSTAPQSTSSPPTTIITAMKLDCEGCEFAAFEDLVKANNNSPRSNIQIRMLDVELHFASTLGMVDETDVARMYYAHIYLKQNHCQLVRHRRHAGFDVDRNKVPAMLVEAGVSPHHCCYEMTYVCGIVD